MPETAPFPRALPFRKLQKSLARLTHSEPLGNRKALKLSKGKLRVPLDALPLVLSFGKQGGKLQLFPETALARSGKLRFTGNLLLREQARQRNGLRRDVRLAPGQSLALMRDEDGRVLLPGVNARVADALLTLKLFDDELLLLNPGVTSRIRAKPLDATRIAALVENRVGRLRRLREVLGARIEASDPDAAMDLLQQVNEVMAREAHRPTDRRGKPGGLVSLPDRLQPLILGSLHGSTDNLLAVLTRSTVLDGLESGRLCLLLLGDAVHRPDAATLEDMEQSMAMMDLVFRLKLSFPEQVFYLRGNHDGFSEAPGGGTPQGLLWWRALKRARGKRYRKAMEDFYGLLPCIVASRDFIACHAAAPTSKVDRGMLIDALQYPALEQELTEGNRHKEYGRGDVKRLRKAMGVEPDTPFLVGRSPEDDTAPQNRELDGIPAHCMVYSGAPQWVGAVALIDGDLVPFNYPAEPLTELYNSL
jgi:hypothetical protein